MASTTSRNAAAPVVVTTATDINTSNPANTAGTSSNIISTSTSSSNPNHNLNPNPNSNSSDPVSPKVATEMETENNSSPSRSPSNSKPKTDSKGKTISKEKERGVEKQKSKEKEKEKEKQMSDQYNTIESRIAWDLLCGGNRHFAYYDDPSSVAATWWWWPFPPIGKGQRRMQGVLLDTILSSSSHDRDYDYDYDYDYGSGGIGSGGDGDGDKKKKKKKKIRLLDAGCGDGHVAVDLASRLMGVNRDRDVDLDVDVDVDVDVQITAFDVVERHVENARRNVAKAGLEGKVVVERFGFEDVVERLLLPRTFSEEQGDGGREGEAEEEGREEGKKRGMFDGVYTSEALLHAFDPVGALKGFWQVLKPGGRAVLHEYHNDFMKGELIGFPLVIAARGRETSPGDGGEGDAPLQQQEAAFPRVKAYFEEIMAEAGFEDVVVRDYSANIEPMAKLLNISALWRHIVLLFRLHRLFPNTAARREGYVGRQHWAYVSVSGTKPRGGS